MENIDNSADKKVSEGGLIKVISNQGCVSYDGKLKKIRGRGNSTWNCPIKKPYNINIGKSVELLEMHKGKKYCLLSNNTDRSNSRDYLAHYFARNIGMKYAVSSEYVSLYLNGKYNGLYLLTNDIEVGKDEILDIPEITIKEGVSDSIWEEGFRHSKIDKTERYSFEDRGAIQGDITGKTEEGDISGSYFIERYMGLEQFRKKIKCGFVSDKGILFRIKSPKHCTKEEVTYIRDNFNTVDSAVISDDGINHRTGKHFAEYLDITSFAQYYILSEFLSNYDYGNFYMFKLPDNVGGKLYAGPIWDFNASLGKIKYGYRGIPEVFIHRNGFASHACHYKGIIGELFKHKLFRERVDSILTSSLEPVFNSFFQEPMETLKGFLEYENSLDYSRWPYRGLSDFDFQMQYLKRKFAFLLEESISADNGKYSVYCDEDMHRENLYNLVEYRIPYDSIFAVPTETYGIRFKGWKNNHGEHVESVSESCVLHGDWYVYFLNPFKEFVDDITVFFKGLDFYS